MDVIGQFNLGFIVVRLRKTVSNGNDDPDEMDDLFINVLPMKNIISRDFNP